MNNKPTIEYNQQDLDRLEQDLNQLESGISHAAYTAIEDVKNLWVQNAVAANYMETGEYIRSFHVSDARDIFVKDAKDIFLENSSGYSLIGEFGRRDTPNYEARHIAGKSLEQFDNQNKLEQRITENLDKILEKK